MKLEETEAYKRRAAEWNPDEWDYTEWEECLSDAAREISATFSPFTMREVPRLKTDKSWVTHYQVLCRGAVMMEFPDKPTAENLINKLNDDVALCQQHSSYEWMGYESADQMNADHDPLHINLSYWIGFESHALRQARGEQLTQEEQKLANYEEDAILYLQRYMQMYRNHYVFTPDLIDR